ncbi:uncharacterized protein LOC124311473 [Daphnia pulicaria]|uniref:uncharacterized protein LOC124311473 n=1 Tax=Daphnia pulicaria TaxID=35523 RepID=UPI001EEA9F72|nr:uncharacterized protein LOC124311473 [Daphnia pulicaria]
MGFVTVVIQLALFLVFSISCQNTTGVAEQREHHALETALFLTKVNTQCISYRYVPCRMKTTTVIYEDEEMDDPNLSESNDTIRYDFQCVSYRFIPCREVSQNLILKVVNEQERLQKTRSTYSKRLRKCEEDKNYDLSLLATESYCLTSRLTECEISQLISLEKMKMSNEKEQILTQQLAVTKNQKFVLLKDKITLTDRVKNSDENLKVCKELVHNVTLQLADSKMEKIKTANDAKNQLGLIRQEFNDETKLMYTSIAKTFSGTPFSGDLLSYTLYQMGSMRIVPKPNIQPLVPQYGIVFNDVTSIRYNLAISPCKNSADNSRSVFIAVISAPENRESRDKIRQTWKKHVEEINRLNRNSDRNCPLFCNIEFAFVLGPTTNTSSQISITEESTKYKDIIQISDTQEFPSYMTMPGVINWIYSRCPQIDFLFKVEDDMHVNVHKLAYFVRDFYQFGNTGNMTIYSQQNGDESNIGRLNKYKPKRSGEKMVTLDEWPWNTYPKYFNGPAYLMHKSTILPLLAAIQTTPAFFLEEVYITGICADKAGLSRRASSRSLPVMWPWAPKTVNTTWDAINLYLTWKNTVSYISHKEIDAFYSGLASNPMSCNNYRDSQNFVFFPLD